MTPNELHDLLILHGHPAQVRGDEVLIETCWFCGNARSNLELNPVKGIFSCWVCHESGRLDHLLSKKLGGSFQIPIDFDEAPGLSTSGISTEFESKPAHLVESARRYLERRGLSTETIVTYNVRVCVAKDHPLFGRIVFPLFDFWTMEVVDWVGRSYTGAFPKYIHTVTEGRIFGYRLRDHSKPVIIVEGALDGIAVHRAGFQAAILLGTSSPGIEDFAARLATMVPLGILLDGSARQEAQHLFWRTQPIHPKVFAIDLPQEFDPANLLPSTLRRLIEISLKKGLDVLQSSAYYSTVERDPPNKGERQ